MLLLCALVALASLKLATSQFLPNGQSLPCLIEPQPHVAAGSELLLSLPTARNSTCEGTVSFANATFLPIAATVVPHNCSGDQTAAFKIPKSSPNGTAVLQWQCVGLQGVSCNLFNITAGSADYDLFQTERDTAKVRVVCNKFDPRIGDGGWSGGSRSLMSSVAQPTCYDI